MTKIQLEMRIRALLIFFMVALVISGLTAIPLEEGIKILRAWFGEDSFMQTTFSPMAAWIERVYVGIMETGQNHRFMFYGTDWLAFAHVVIAIAFIGPLRDPVKNIWVLEFGMIACVLVIPWGMFFALLRGLPVFWLPIDFSFGVFGFLPLWLARKYILALSKIGQNEIR